MGRNNFTLLTFNLYNTEASSVTFRPELQAYFEVILLNPRTLTICTVSNTHFFVSLGTAEDNSTRH